MHFDNSLALIDYVTMFMKYSSCFPTKLRSVASSRNSTSYGGKKIPLSEIDQFKFKFKSKYHNLAQNINLID